MIEVADASLPFDRNIKLPLYGRSGIAEVWLFDSEAGQMYVFQEPSADVYHSSRSAGPDDVLTARTLPGVSVSVGKVLP